MQALPAPRRMKASVATFVGSHTGHLYCSLSTALVERFVSLFQVKLLVAGKVEAHRAAVQMVWDAG
jgi:hypothetical protein